MGARVCYRFHRNTANENTIILHTLVRLIRDLTAGPTVSYPESGWANFWPLNPLLPATRRSAHCPHHPASSLQPQRGYHTTLAFLNQSQGEMRI